jgi:hypothetical protein
MKITAAALLLAASLTVAASTVGVVAPAHAYAGQCYSAARLYRTDFNYEPPPVCWGSVWFRSTDGQHWDRPLPLGQDQGTRPPPPAGIPPPPPGDNDEPPPPDAPGPASP